MHDFATKWDDAVRFPLKSEHSICGHSGKVFQVQDPKRHKNMLCPGARMKIKQ